MDCSRRWPTSPSEISASYRTVAAVYDRRQSSGVTLPAVIDRRYSSEYVLQCELHDPRISGSGYLTEQVVVENRRRIHHVETVCNVERLGAELDVLAFTNLECSRKREIELPRAGTGNAVAASIPQCSQIR